MKKLTKETKFCDLSNTDRVTIKMALEHNHEFLDKANLSQIVKELGRLASGYAWAYRDLKEAIESYNCELASQSPLDFTVKSDEDNSVFKYDSHDLYHQEKIKFINYVKKTIEKAIK